MDAPHGGVANTKPSSVLEIGGTLYWAVSCFNYGDDAVFNRQRWGPTWIITSTDKGKTWDLDATPGNFFTGRLGGARFIQFGQGYRENKDGSASCRPNPSHRISDRMRDRLSHAGTYTHTFRARPMALLSSSRTMRYGSAASGSLVYSTAPHGSSSSGSTQPATLATSLTTQLLRRYLPVTYIVMAHIVVAYIVTTVVYGIYSYGQLLCRHLQ